jgi:hypothetical protein
VVRVEQLHVKHRGEDGKTADSDVELTASASEPNTEKRPWLELAELLAVAHGIPPDMVKSLISSVGFYFCYITSTTSYDQVKASATEYLDTAYSRITAMKAMCQTIMELKTRRDDTIVLRLSRSNGRKWARRVALMLLSCGLTLSEVCRKQRPCLSNSCVFTCMLFAHCCAPGQRM